jgi:hypothetical protein
MNSKQRRKDRRLSNAFEGGLLLLDKSEAQCKDITRLNKINDRRIKLSGKK